jgi:hypothetical protein
VEQAKRRVPAVAVLAPDRGVAASASAPESIGAYLALQRRVRGISIEELAQATRIPMRSLQRLEAGAFDADPDGFARGFVRTVAQALGLPPDETVARMLPEVDAGSDGPGRLRLRRAARVLLAMAVLAAVAAGVWVARGITRSAGAAGTEGRLVRRDAVRALALEGGLLEDAPPDAAPTDAPRR